MNLVLSVGYQQVILWQKLYFTIEGGTDFGCSGRLADGREFSTYSLKQGDSSTSMTTMPAPFSPDGYTYSPEERARLKAAFAPVAANYRMHSHRMHVCIMITGFTTISLFVPDSTRWLGILLLLVGLVTTFFFSSRVAAVSLVCPGCAMELDTLHKYCSNCGSTDLTDLFAAMNRHYPNRISTATLAKKRKLILCCNRCFTERMSGKEVPYSIHFCSTCGLYLDEQGLYK